MKHPRRLLVFIFFAICLLGLSAWVGCTTPLFNRMTARLSDFPRYTKLPLFDPHRQTFTCVYQDQHIPPVDPQAELWYEQALELNDPNVWFEKRNWNRIYQLYVQAAERNHWKAMLNLASLILSGYPIPEHDPELAIRWVEKAMKLGVADAWDRMGTYHQNGLIKGSDATSAYAFLQKAADMGSPAALTFLGDKLGGTYDDPEGDFWGNRPIALQMLKCAMAQGYGEAAYELSFYQADANTPEAKALALRTLQEGTKLGSANCAKSLGSEFDGFDLTDGTNLIGYVDKERHDRYRVLADALEFWQGRLKLPNLDKVLPLPPAPLPKWNGDKQTLIDAAKAVTPPPKPARTSLHSGREAVPEGHAVPSLTKDARSISGDQRVPRTGYWLALHRDMSTSAETRPIAVASAYPQHYEAGEPFELPRGERIASRDVRWHYLGEAYKLATQPHEILEMRVKAGKVRQLTDEPRSLQCSGEKRCAQTGIWEARVAADHPLAALFNRWDRQAFVETGHAFPDVRQQHLDVAAGEVRWTYLGSPNTLRVPGVFDISL